MRGTWSMLRLYNTQSRKKEPFRPRSKNTVKIFTCGPSIYQRPHLGNYRTFLFEDILVRYLDYLGYDVTRVLNFTDIEDKAVKEAEREGMDVIDLTNGIANKYFEEANILHLYPPSFNPRSSTSIDQAVFLIKKLMKNKIAYWYENDVFYDPLKYKDFGSLYGLDMTKWPKKKRHFKKDTYTGMRWNLGDFILWHGCDEGEKVCWDKELGSGRPSWNVQDPAMATKYLGYEIDIHCGGIDNLYRHHDYNKAVVEGVSHKKFSNFWLHGGHLLLDGKKMSKSKGNVLYVEDLISKKYSPEHIRFYLIYGHYREKMNLTEKRLRKSTDRLDDLRIMIDEVSKKKGIKRSVKGANDIIENIGTDFEITMNNDLDVKAAFDSIYEDLSRLFEMKEQGKLSDAACKRTLEELRKIDSVLQVIFT
jgi:cysteinyl-tRNA synthetase